MSDTSTPSSRPPTVLGNFLQPGFPFAKVFSVLFMNGGMVFAKTGSGGTNAAGTLRASLGGSSPVALIASAIGTLYDTKSQDSRSAKTGQLGGQAVQDIVAADKRNFFVPFTAVKQVQVKVPHFGGEVKVIIEADKTHKFRIDRQSKESAKRIVSGFNEFLPGKVLSA